MHTQASVYSPEQHMIILQQKIQTFESIVLKFSILNFKYIAGHLLGNIDDVNF
jgi:hypothetical protein